MLVQLCWQDSEGRVFNGPGTIRNISAEGFGVEWGQSLAVDQLVTVRTSAASLECVVRHSELGSKDFLIGVLVLPSSRCSLKALEKLSNALSAAQRKLPYAIGQGG
jgi:hypothetical protein